MTLRFTNGYQCLLILQLKRQREGVENVDDDIEDYDYENANDRDNFCPAGDMVGIFTYIVSITYMYNCTFFLLTMFAEKLCQRF